MSPAKAIANHLASHGIGVIASTTGWAIAVGREPDTPPNCITVYDTGGGTPDTDQMDIRRPSFQVRVRGMTYPEAYAKQEEILELLLLPRPSMDVNFSGVFAQTDIISLGVDDSNRHVLTVNYRTIRRA